jgi:hypothetical protein
MHVKLFFRQAAGCILLPIAIALLLIKCVGDGAEFVYDVLKGCLDEMLGSP